MIKLVAFDLDGTIGDTIPMCIKAFRQAVSPYAGHLLTDREVVETFGLNDIGMIKSIVPEKWKQALYVISIFYMKNCIMNAPSLMKASRIRLPLCGQKDLSWH